MARRADTILHSRTEGCVCLGGSEEMAISGGCLPLVSVVEDEEGLQSVLADVPDAGDLLASLDADDVASLLTGPDFARVADR